MNNPAKLKKLISQGEGLSLEFKRSTNKLPASFFETVCAFLNLDGGTIILGVEDDGTVSGVNPDTVASIKQEIANLSNNPQKVNPPNLLFPYEELGSGVRKVNHYLPHYAPNAGKPLFIDGNIFEVTVPLGEVTAQVTVQVTGEVTGEAAGEVTGEVTGEVFKLLSALTVPLTRTELQRKMGLKDQDHFRNHYLAPALQADLIEMTIPEKPTSRLQKYRLTAKGRVFLG